MSKIFISNKKKLLRGGASLTEVLFSAAIIALVVVSVLVIFVQTVDISKRINREYTAATLAKNRIEGARTFIEESGFDSLTPARFGEDTTRVDSNGISDENGDYLRSTTVQTSYGGNVRLTRITVDIKYEHMGREKQEAITMDTIFANIGEE